MSKDIKTYTYLDIRVYASAKIYAWLMIRELCGKNGVKAPKLNEIIEN